MIRKRGARGRDNEQLTKRESRTVPIAASTCVAPNVGRFLIESSTLGPLGRHASAIQAELESLAVQATVLE